ncbi:hypothetical protein CSTERTH_01035 [Thermoclostridium stercorarium subsp. thermolacticum DSM 2910]|uniref:Uncharacterized protein n=1 Tax=Thermoclostridium stercorarium subsp. thermolacticum DSM 2910 TaxID=1121336 RepID=A0A1B1YAB1_THEST|nr:hypothetical protein [Thermoclostridium stercorarium]ANW97713.1 hypothetical protein CSTERTH_01035 [Thermoclostridium stercorarium subsp. thermolacticum DSM 2910]
MDKIKKDKLIKAELRKLNKFFQNIPEDKQKIIKGLKEQAAFMYATLMELQEIMNTEGPVEMFEQGKQKMLREHPASKVYNSMIKNYSSVIKQLLELMPTEEKKAAEDELLAFIKKAK